MDLVELADMGRGCEDKNCGLSSGFPEHCSNQDCQWEEPMFGLIELVCVTVIYIPLMLFGLLGNILTILVVWLRPHMRSSTYLYLSSMAVSDLLILLLLPLDLYKLWRPRPWLLGDIACKLTMFLSECCTFCTILHITFLSLERYVAVCWPIAAKTLVTRRRTRALIGCLWLGAAVSAAPVLIMVGVEEVGGEEVAFGGWREDAGWTGREGEKGAFVIGGGERGNGHLRLMGGGPEGIQWDEKETIGLGEREKLFKEEGERKLEILETDDRKQGDGGEREDGNQVDTRGGEEEGGKMEDDRMQQNKMKEDEGGGKEEEEEDVVEGGEWDMRECRCTHYAVSSGLLSAMMILSNLYFLVPLCILGLVYGLIGRTLWLRPQSSRKDQSHRHTVKMLGVIVLAFVLCWLPFHVGRTIFSLSLGSGTEILYYLSQYFNLVSSVLYYLSAAVNPLLYNLMSARYRHAVHSLIHTHCHAQSHRIRKTLDAQTSTTAL
uniref:growth hormone secretagogue receptor type 1-like isoform X2 n=1 Tax=Solea senegalensis TaxID=28829 RepID=UPI001CD8611A|nr:growth hormone secretagogue receptor type 1-like isoform X2 [Solea senegalensis]